MKKGLGCLLLLIGFSYGALGDFIADGDLADCGMTCVSDWNSNVGTAEWIEPDAVNPDIVEGEPAFCKVPEPTTLLLVGTGCLLGLGYYLRRRMN
ncbi:MAG: hypothetical protein AMS16_01965 [Planctomycetes bacterium DG_58]|nr:MAG: hypothetical protein AMS16_01965 [Planctomycetes bacterium DG_58]